MNFLASENGAPRMKARKSCGLWVNPLSLPLTRTCRIPKRDHVRVEAANLRATAVSIPHVVESHQCRTQGVVWSWCFPANVILFGILQCPSEGRTAVYPSHPKIFLLSYEFAPFSLASKFIRILDLCRSFLLTHLFTPKEFVQQNLF